MKKTILCFGDSNTYGYNPENGMRYAKNERWTGRLAQLLGDHYTVIEEGCNGRTTVFDDPIEGWKNGIQYLRPCLNSHKPVDLVILMLGTNDLKKIFQASVEDVGAGIQQILDVILTFTKEKQGFSSKILLVSPMQIGEQIEQSPFSRSFDETAVVRSKQFAELYEQIARETSCYFLDAAKVTLPSELDQVHLSRKGHEKLADAIGNLIKNNIFLAT